MLVHKERLLFFNYGVAFNVLNNIQTFNTEDDTISATLCNYARDISDNFIPVNIVPIERRKCGVFRNLRNYPRTIKWQQIKNTRKSTFM